MRNFSSLKEVLPLALGKVAVSTTAAAPLQAVWGEAVGAAIANNAAPVSLIGGTLLIATSNAAWAEELHRRARQLLPRLQQHFGPGVLRRLEFKVKG